MKMKKVLLMGMICMVTLVNACGKGSENASVEPENIETTERSTQKEQEQVVEEVVESEENALLPNVYRVPAYEIYVNVPDMHSMEEGFTQVYYEDAVKYITFTCDRIETATDAENAFEVAYETFVSNMFGLDTINQLNEVSGEMTEINGITVYAFEGTLNCGFDPIYDAYMKGYSFIYQDMPCAIIGVVKDSEQPQEQIDAVKELVDAMILTVRSEK